VKFIDYINYEYFANMKDAIYGKGLPRGTQGEKKLGTTAIEYTKNPLGYLSDK
jgi:hypothetical protein